MRRAVAAVAAVAAVVLLRMAVGAAAQLRASATPSAPPAAAVNLTTVLQEFVDAQSRQLDAMTRLEARPDRSADTLEELNRTRASMTALGDAITVTRFLAQLEDEVAAKREEAAAGETRVAKLLRTLDLLRADNDERATEYLRYLDDAVVGADKATRAYADGKMKLEAELAAWQARQRAAHADALARANKRVGEEGNSLARARASLIESYRVAGAAKRLQDTPKAPHVNPAIGATTTAAAAAAAAIGWTEARAADYGIVSAYDEEVATLREQIAALQRDNAAAAAQVRAERSRQAELGMAGGRDGAGGGSDMSTATQAADTALASAMRKQVNALMELVRRMLQSHHAAQLDARAAKTGNATSGSSADSLEAWSATAAELAADVAALEAEAAKLKAAREILEDELARRASRAGRAVSTTLGAATGLGAGGAVDGAFGAGQGLSPGGATSPAAAALIAAVQQGGGVAAASPPARALIYSTAIQRLLVAAGVSPATALAPAGGVGGVNLGTGGVHGLGGCEYCAAQRAIGRLAEEVHALRRELDGCRATPAAYKPDCAPRLQFEVDRLLAEMRRRQAVLVSEETEMQRVSAALARQLAACDATGNGTLGGGGDNSTCLPPHRGTLQWYQRLLRTEVDMRARMNDLAATRKQFACLWQHRKNAVAEAVASVLTEGDTAADASFATSLAFLEVAAHDGGTRSEAAVDEEATADAATALSRADEDASAGDGDADTAASTAGDEQEQPASPQTTSPTTVGALQQLQGSNHAARLARMLRVCTALRDPTFDGGSELRTCLCAEVEEVAALRKTAETDAAARAATWAQASRAASEAALRDAAQREAAAAQALEAAKTRLFERLRNDPAYAKLVQASMAGSGGTR